MKVGGKGLATRTSARRCWEAVRVRPQLRLQDAKPGFSTKYEQETPSTVPVRRNSGIIDYANCPLSRCIDPGRGRCLASVSGRGEKKRVDEGAPGMLGGPRHSHLAWLERENSAGICGFDYQRMSR